MKHILITIAAVLLVGCGESQQSTNFKKETKQEATNFSQMPEIDLSDASANNGEETITSRVWEDIRRGNYKAISDYYLSEINVNTKITDPKGGASAWYPLNWASANGRIEIVEFLLSKGAVINSRDGAGFIALHYATGRGPSHSCGKNGGGRRSSCSCYQEEVNALIAKGEDVNMKLVDGSTPLDLAAINPSKNEKIVDLIRKHGGKHGTFVGAVSGGDIEEVKQFLVAGADANKKWRGNAPLMAAATSGHNEIVELLLNEGAKVNAITRTFRDLTALDEAIKQKHTEIIDLLRKHGGKTGEELKAEGK